MDGGRWDPAPFRDGADPDRLDRPRTRPGWTPLMNAVHKGQAGAVRMLIEAGAKVNACAPDGTAPLMLAAPEGRIEILEALLAAGADPYLGDRGSTALPSDVPAGQVRNVKALLARGPDLRLQKGIFGTIAPWLARIQGRGDLLRLIESRGSGGRTRPAQELRWGSAGSASPAP